MFTWAKQPAKSVNRFFQASKILPDTFLHTKAASSVKCAVANFRPICHSTNTSQQQSFGKVAKEKCILKTLKLSSTAVLSSSKILLFLKVVKEMAFCYDHAAMMSKLLVEISDTKSIFHLSLRPQPVGKNSIPH
jgi:hypothetical protein